MVGTQIFATVLISMLILIGEHFWPWEEMISRPLKLVERYILGVLAMMLPFSGLLILWQLWLVLITLWLIILFSGLITVVMFHLDSSWNNRDRANLAEQAEKVLKDGTLTHE